MSSPLINKVITWEDCGGQADGACQKCKQHKATENWVWTGSTMDFVHGNYQRCCKCCCLSEKLEYVRKLTKTIPELKRKLATVECKS